MVRFLIIGDLHGNVPKIYRKDFDAIIAPGDFCSDALRKYMFEALKRRMNGDEVEWYEIVGKKKAQKMVRKSLRDGRKILFMLNKIGKPIFALPGNWDWTGDEDWTFLDRNYWKTYLIKGLKNIRNCHRNKFAYNGLTIIGHGITSGPEFPIHKIKSLTKKEIVKEKKKYQREYFIPMNKKFSNVKKPVMFLTHNVPYNTKLDKINNPTSPRHGEHMGSYLARELILKHKPMVAIGGHMHEHFGKTKLGKTLVINAGFGSYVNTILDIEDGKIKKIEFIKDGKRL